MKNPEGKVIILYTLVMHLDPFAATSGFVCMSFAYTCIIMLIMAEIIFLD